MNYQSSFSQGTRSPHDFPIDGLRWIALDDRAVVPDSPIFEEGVSIPPPGRGAQKVDLERHGARDPTASNRDESRQRVPRPEERDGASREDGEQEPEQPRRRIPDSDIIYVGTSDPGPGPVPEPAPGRDLVLGPPNRPVGPASADDPSARRRSLVGPLVALLVLEIVVTGGIYLRNRYVESQVIVVPPTGNERSAIT